MLNQSKRAKQDKKNQLEQIKDLMGLLRRHPQVLVLFERFKISIDEFDKIQIGIKEMDVSAKTKDGKIWLNECLIEDGNLVEDLHYVVHELVHWLQQRTGLDSYHEPDNYSSYLFIPTEIQAFKEQIEFIRNYKGAKEAKKYLKDLLDFHELEGDERKELEELLGGDLAETKKPNHVRIDVRDSEGRQLQHHYLKRNYWDRPAGRIEGSEEPVEAAVRELEERTGFRADEDDLRPIGETADFYEFEADLEDLDQVAEPQTRIRMANDGAV